MHLYLIRAYLTIGSVQYVPPNDRNVPIKVELIFTGDGTRAGYRNLFFGGFKQPDQCSRTMCIPFLVYIGKDNDVATRECMNPMMTWAEAIDRECRAGKYFVVDGGEGVGMVEFDMKLKVRLSEEKFDIVISYKWFNTVTPNP
jgi:hypothetical protein